VTSVASGDEDVSVWEGLPEDLKALFTAHASHSTTTSVLEENDYAESKDGAVVDENKNVDPNHTLLKMTLALEGKVDRHMERLEAGLALNEVMSVLKMVRMGHAHDHFFLRVFQQLLNTPDNRQTKH